MVAQKRQGRGPNKDQTSLKKNQKQGPTEAQIQAKEQWEAQKVENMDALELARKSNLPLKMIIPDPTCTSIYQVHLQIPNELLLELLYADLDVYNVFRQVLAVRSIGKAGLSRDESNPLVAKKTQPAALRLHMKALDGLFHWQGAHQERSQVPYDTAQRLCCHGGCLCHRCMAEPPRSY